MVDPERILLIEDDHHIRNFVASALESEGYKVFTASNAARGASERADHHAGKEVPPDGGLLVGHLLRAWFGLSAACGAWEFRGEGRLPALPAHARDASGAVKD